MRMRLLTLVLATAFIAAPAVHAAGTGWYVGVGAGQSKAKDVNDTSGFADYIKELLEEEFEDLSEVEVSPSSDDKDTGWKVYAGYRINKNFAVEGGYVHFGKFGYSGSFSGKIDDGEDIEELTGSASLKAKAKALTLSALGIVPVSQNFEVFGKLGIAYWDVKKTETGSLTIGVESGSVSDSESKKGTGLNFGLGAMYNINKNLSVRAEWERFNDVGKEETTGKTDIDLISLGVMFNF